MANLLSDSGCTWYRPVSKHKGAMDERGVARSDCRSARISCGVDEPSRVENDQAVLGFRVRLLRFASSCSSFSWLNGARL